MLISSPGGLSSSVGNITKHDFYTGTEILKGVGIPDDEDFF
jgi:hypothetical protein